MMKTVISTKNYIPYTISNRLVKYIAHKNVTGRRTSVFISSFYAYRRLCVSMSRIIAKGQGQVTKGHYMKKSDFCRETRVL